jgi:PX-associated
MDSPRRSPARKPTREIIQLPVIDVESSNTSTPLIANHASASPTTTHGEEDDNAPSRKSRDDSADLTPVRAHYLKKSLIQLQFNKELDAITSNMPNNVSALSFLGPPFTPPPKNGPVIELPLLRYVFKQFVLTFPFLAEAPKDFFPEKLQPFVVSMLSRNLSPGDILDEEDSEHAAQATRLKLLKKIEKSLSILLVSAIKLVEPEQVVRLTQADLNRLELLARKRITKEKKSRDSFEVNIISVRTIVDKGRVRTRAHDVCLLPYFHLRGVSNLVSVGIYNPNSPRGSSGHFCFS